MDAYIIYGPPASGKSTRAKEIISSLKNGNYMHIERDIIRFNLLKLGDWTTYTPNPRDEYIVDGLWKYNLYRAIEAKANIVISDTLINDRDRKNLTYLLEKYSYNVVVDRIDLPLDDCLQRNALRGKLKVDEEVLTKMWEKHNGNNKI